MYHKIIHALNLAISQTLFWLIIACRNDNEFRICISVHAIFHAGKQKFIITNDWQRLPK